MADLRGIQLDSLFGSIQEYVTYAGSITSPPCSENVQWIISNKAISIKEPEVIQFRILHQVQKFENLYSGIVAGNLRPVQETNRRAIITNIDFVPSEPGVSSALNL
ncbi:hypothetical protein Ciccas_012663 [Cichlidogyrus casuarinus]|uniref:Alpha-carbonic anhydrase domain-containing protein n=1 Tax=Cichlidogyrus casuarinus TaxID=1844966 RepID=A0ABD2PNF8_9PLAT